MKRHDEIVLVEDNEDDVAIAMRAFRKRGIEGTVTVLDLIANTGPSAREHISSRTANEVV